MKNWINAKLEIMKQRVIKLGKILLALLVIYFTVRFDAFWISIPAVIAYHIYMIPTYWNRYLNNQRKKWKEHLANVDKDSKHWKVERKSRFGIEV